MVLPSGVVRGGAQNGGCEDCIAESAWARKSASVQGGVQDGGCEDCMGW